jgi:CBS domain-containing protein
MVTCPTTHGPSATVGQLRAFFVDSHKHAAVLVDQSVLVGVVERRDLTTKLGDGAPARTIATLDGRTVCPTASADDALAAMRRDGCRRLAVVSGGGQLLGLLCLKASGIGFCSDADVASRGRTSEPSG